MQVKFCNINPKSSEILVFTKELPETLTQSCPSTDQQMCQVDRRTSPFLWNLSVMTLYILYNHVYTSPMYIIQCCTSVFYMSLCTYLFAGHLIQTWRAACRPWSQRCPSPLSAGWSSWHNFQTSEDSFVLKLRMTAGIHSDAESSRNIRNFILHSFLRHYWKCSTTQVSPTPHSASLKWSRPEILPPTWSRSGRWELFCVWRRIFKGDKDKPDLEQAEQDAGNDEDECMH